MIAAYFLALLKKNKKDDDNKTPPAPRGRATKKTPVVGMVEHDGSVKAKSTSKFELAFRDFLKFVRKNIDIATSILITDEYKACDKMDKVLPHYSINHSKEYSSNGIHANSIEGFWTILKRGIMGQFHWVSKKHLDLYIDEFCYRYNARNNDESVVFENILNNMLMI